MSATDQDQVKYVPSTPDPRAVLLVSGVIRALIAALAGVGLGVGEVSDSSIQIVAGALVIIGTIAWSVYDHKRAGRKDHAGSVRSAITGTPVKAV